MCNSADVSSNELGQTTLSGEALTLYKKLDLFFTSLGDNYKTKDFLFPPFLKLEELNKIAYLDSFPHLATFMTAAKKDDDNLKNLGQHSDADFNQSMNPINEILTPAACYHFYIHFQNTAIKNPLYLTTKSTCYRKEAEFIPLKRQWAFSMRELVCIGTKNQVQEFLDFYKTQLTNIINQWGLELDWQIANDPFFNPNQNPKYIMQKLQPSKFELCYNDLAIASINAHQSFFGESYNITINDEPAYSGCVAFGLHRWVYLFLEQFESKLQWPKDLQKLETL